MDALDTLKDLDSFEVRIEGRQLESFLSKKRCVYFEWNYGEKGADGWIVFWMGHHSTEPLIVTTPKGNLELALDKIRLYLAPSQSRVFTRKDARSAPPHVRKELAKKNRSLTVEEHCI